MTEREQIRSEIKRQLNSYRELQAEHLQLSEELKRLEVLMGSPGSPNIDGMPRSSGVSNPVERIGIKIITLEERYRAQLEKLLAAQETIEKMIEGLEPTERMLARFRYIDGLSWDNVSIKMNYSWRQTHRIHGRMLDKLVAAKLSEKIAQDLTEGKITMNAAREALGLPPVVKEGVKSPTDEL